MRPPRTPRCAARGGRGGYDWCNNGGQACGFGVVPAAVAPNAAPVDDAPSARVEQPTPGTLSLGEQGSRGRSQSNGAPLYFSNIRVDPTNDKVIFVANTRAKSRWRQDLHRHRRRLGFAARLSTSMRIGSIHRTRSIFCCVPDSGLGELGPGPHVGVCAHDGHGPRVSRDGGHASSV
jgi:hypothetical protein